MLLAILLYGLSLCKCDLQKFHINSVVKSRQTKRNGEMAHCVCVQKQVVETVGA